MNDIQHKLPCVIDFVTNSSGDEKGDWQGR